MCSAVRKDIHGTTVKVCTYHCYYKLLIFTGGADMLFDMLVMVGPSDLEGIIFSYACFFRKANSRLELLHLCCRELNERDTDSGREREHVATYLQRCRLISVYLLKSDLILRTLLLWVVTAGARLIRQMSRMEWVCT